MMERSDQVEPMKRNSPERVKEGSASPPPRDQMASPSSPVMLATMTPVSVIEFQKEYEQHQPEHPQKIIYVQQDSDEIIMEGNQTFTTEIEDGTTPTYHGAPGATVLVLSELVEDMSPLLGLRFAFTLSIINQFSLTHFKAARLYNNLCMAGICKIFINFPVPLNYTIRF
ncbi:uncharacterized protein LOC112127895 [Cimex lectularius]|uniref:Uncharacterized protein n=1 Tax=Cimex lectularius TaxID=79782 RepID=A0A8I6SV02_CIMLE|nr:uncharacterized protein LOC112127895 [Cimex lectularius]XP_024085210.1 uncharacterized protein LOC112127895 [Cimex lectularius]